MGTTAEKLQYLNTTKANIRTAINNHGGDLTENDTFRSYSNAIESVCIELERYKNAFPYAIAEGESLTLEDSAELPYKLFNVKGKSEQATSILPEGYTQVEYIESTGTQYIDTNYVFKSNDNIFIKFIFTK